MSQNVCKCVRFRWSGIISLRRLWFMQGTLESVSGVSVLKMVKKVGGKKRGDARTALFNIHMFYISSLCEDDISFLTTSHLALPNSIYSTACPPLPSSFWEASSISRRRKKINTLCRFHRPEWRALMPWVANECVNKNRLCQIFLPFASNFIL